MSQPEIPDNNLSVYLQEYEVNILDTIYISLGKTFFYMQHVKNKKT